jgi:hypothetical protein
MRFPGQRIIRGWIIVFGIDELDQQGEVMAIAAHKDFPTSASLCISRKIGNTTPARGRFSPPKRPMMIH